jgi:nicotinate-nucleotide adenylyltransferase
VAELARQLLRLDQVWLLVSPGNVLKPSDGMGNFRDRLASARVLADGRRIVATGIEAALGTRYSIDTLRRLRRIFPLVEFVWVMGADILEQLPRWGRWHELVHRVPFVVLPRPSYTHRALAGTAAHYLRAARLPARAAAVLARTKPPAWVFLPSPQHNASASAIRAGKGAVP